VGDSALIGLGRALLDHLAQVVAAVTVVVPLLAVRRVLGVSVVGGAVDGVVHLRARDGRAEVVLRREVGLDPLAADVALLRGLHIHRILGLPVLGHLEVRLMRLAVNRTDQAVEAGGGLVVEAELAVESAELVGGQGALVDQGVARVPGLDLDGLAGEDGVAVTGEGAGDALEVDQVAGAVDGAIGVSVNAGLALVLPAVGVDAEEGGGAVLVGAGKQRALLLGAAGQAGLEDAVLVGLAARVRAARSAANCTAVGGEGEMDRGPRDGLAGLKVNDVGEYVVAPGLHDQAEPGDGEPGELLERVSLGGDEVDAGLPAERGEVHALAEHALDIPPGDGGGEVAGRGEGGIARDHLVPRRRL